MGRLLKSLQRATTPESVVEFHQKSIGAATTIILVIKTLEDDLGHSRGNSCWFYDEENFRGFFDCKSSYRLSDVENSHGLSNVESSCWFYDVRSFLRVSENT